MKAARFTAILLTGILSLRASCAELRILAWNVESGSPSQNDHANGADPAAIAEDLVEFSGYDIFALTEVSANDAEQYIEACGAGESGNFQGFFSVTGGGDRQVIAFNSDRFALVDGPHEVHEHEGMPLNLRDDDGDFRFRSPMYVVLRDNSTGTEFIFMVVHLARGSNAGPNTIQATGLRAWAEDQELPLIIAGDTNFDYNHETASTPRPGLGILTEGDVVEWIMPDPMVDTNWADRFFDGEVPEDDSEREDQFPNSVLDFVFAAGDARAWAPVSDIIVRNGDLPDQGETSDHRPVEGIFQLPDIVHAPSADSTNELLQQILQRLDSIEQRLDELEN